MYHSCNKIFRLADITPPMDIFDNIDDLQSITHYCFPTTNSVLRSPHVFCEIELDLFLEMTNLQVITINTTLPITLQTSITSLDFLRNCRKLKQVSIHHTCLQDISGLENITTLETVEVDDNPYLTDVSILKTCPSLTRISVSRTNVIGVEVNAIRPPLEITL